MIRYIWCLFQAIYLIVSTDVNKNKGVAETGPLRPLVLYLRMAFPEAKPKPSHTPHSVLANEVCEQWYTEGSSPDAWEGTYSISIYQTSQYPFSCALIGYPSSWTDCHTFVSYFRVFQKFAKMFSLQLCRRTVCLRGKLSERLSDWYTVRPHAAQLMIYTTANQNMDWSLFVMCCSSLCSYYN